MHTANVTLNDLFAQLGLASDDESIKRFVATHRPLPNEVLLPHAPFWTVAQGEFLHQAWKADAEWVPLIDTLDAMLREPAEPPVAAPEAAAPDAG